MAKTKQLKVKISDEFQLFLASAWRQVPKYSNVKGIDSQSDFVINAIMVYISSSKYGKQIIEEYGGGIEEVEWWKNKDSNAIEKKKKLLDMTEDYFKNRLKK